MCSDLLAIVVGVFDSITGATNHGLPVSVYDPIGGRNFLELPLRESISCVEWYVDFFAAVHWSICGEPNKVQHFSYQSFPPPEYRSSR
jgi:hypothetical protein